MVLLFRFFLIQYEPVPPDKLLQLRRKGNIMKKRVVVALGHRALGTTLPEQKVAVKSTAKCIADLIEAGYQVAITHSNAPQVGMIHTALNEFAKNHPEYTASPMSVCTAMSQGYIGYDLQNGIREELLNRGIYRTVSTVLTQVIVDPYDDAFYTPTKVLGRYMNAEEANEERKKGNFVVEEPGKGFRRAVSAPNPVKLFLMQIRLLSQQVAAVFRYLSRIIIYVAQVLLSRKTSQPESLQKELMLIFSSFLQMLRKYVSTLANRMRNLWIQLLLIRQKLTWKRDILEFTTCFQNSVQQLNS